MRESPTDTSVVPLLTLAYLLLGAQNSAGDTRGAADVKGSVLRRAHPELARLLFNDEGA